MGSELERGRSADGTREFHLGDILSVITGRILSPRHIGGVIDLTNFMTGENLEMTAVPRGTDECAGRLLEQHPDLAEVQAPDFGGSQEAVAKWLAVEVARYGAWRKVAPLDPRDDTHIDPLREMRRAAPRSQIVAIDATGDGGRARR
jgi:hypothetical protein